MVVRLRGSTPLSTMAFHSPPAHANMKALSDIVVLDLTHMLAGPFGTLLLADLGAQTIKVEPPGGELTRRLLADDPKFSFKSMGAYSLTLNRNKKSVCIDLKEAEGRALFYELVAKADVVFDNFSVGVTERLEIDYAHLAAVNPRIITCSVTGFGHTGPGHKRTAFDMVVQAAGGGMSITGTPESSPLRAGIPFGDLGGGVLGTVGVLAALHARTVTGRGQHVDIAMLDGQISFLNYMATMYLLSGEGPGALGNAHFLHVPYNAYATKTQHVIIAVITDAFWRSLVEVLGDSRLRDTTFEQQPGRWQNRDFIDRVVQEVLLAETCEHWLDKFAAARIPHGPVNDFGHALDDEQVRFRNMVVDVAYPGGGTVKMPGNPVKLSDTHEETFTPPALCGEHTDEVLRDMLGRSLDDIRRLREAGAIG